MLLAKGPLGKIDSDTVEHLVQRRSDIHYPKPRVLSVTQATEVGTVYNVDEIRKLGQTARRLGLHFHMDGARFASAVASLGVPPKQITWQAGVDVLCFGGTKNGLAVGEAVIFFRHELAAEFAYRCKQAGQLASKMRYLSAPWVGHAAERRPGSAMPSGPIRPRPNWTPAAGRLPASSRSFRARPTRCSSACRRRSSAASASGAGGSTSSSAPAVRGSCAPGIPQVPTSRPC